MNISDLSFDLFNKLILVDSLDDESGELIEMVYSYLSTIVRIPYLEDDEKQNAKSVVEYIESSFRDNRIEQMLFAAKARLNFVEKKLWDFELPENYGFHVNGNILTIKELREQCVPYVDMEICSYIRSSYRYKIIHRIHSDGTIEKIPVYQIFDKDPVGEFHVFNTFGEKAFQE